MPRLYPEALAFCVVWSLLAMWGWSLLGFTAGLLLSVGLFIVVMPTSAIILSRTSNFGLEKAVRWGILLLAALALFSAVDLSR
jgi:Na+-translocating ferredoxin:NAD+ oxidoreductase RnfE subunit